MLKKQLKLPLKQFDQPFHPVILYENYLIRIVHLLEHGRLLNILRYLICIIIDTFTPKKLLIIPRKP